MSSTCREATLLLGSALLGSDQSSIAAEREGSEVSAVVAASKGALDGVGTLVLISSGVFPLALLAVVVVLAGLSTV